MLRCLLFFVIFCCTSLKGLAQQYTGCLVGGLLYYQEAGTHGGRTNYNTSPSVPLSSVFCVEAVTTDSQCRVGGTGSNSGTKQTFFMVDCPIDDYVPLIILLVGGFAFFTIRRINPVTA